MYYANRSIRALAALALAAGTITATSASEEGPIRLYDGGWENIQVNSAIAKRVIEAGFGVPVEIVASDVPDMQRQMIDGTIDVNMEMWRSLMDPWVTARLQAGELVDLGITYESASQGFYVPTYIIEGDARRGIEASAPGLSSVAGLAEHASAFDTGEGTPGWFNCIPGWACREPNRVKMQTYGVAEEFEPIELASEAELNEAILTRYESGEPFVTYYWDPSPMLGQIDMTLLEEPAYSRSCWDAVEEAVEDYTPGNVATEACAYETVAIRKFATDEFVDRYPDIADTLERMQIGTDTVRALVGHMTNDELTPDQTAQYFFAEYPEVWKDWLPEEKSAALYAR